MTSRSSGHFNVPYDPRDWAPGTDTRAAQQRRARENAAEDGLASPPPPYSPKNARSPQQGLERAQTMSSAQSPPQASRGFAQRMVDPMSHTPPSNRHSIHLGSYAPPPPPSTVPPMPRPRVVSEVRPGQEIANTFADPNVNAPSARRAASANAQTSRIPDVGSSRSTPQQISWPHGMPLPGPPPGPPPANSRSQSTSGLFDRPASQIRTRPARQTVHVSGLGPVPPTPSTWTADQELPNTSQAPLHIDTANFPAGSYANVLNPAKRTESGQYGDRLGSNAISAESSSSHPASTLARSAAVRDSSAKGIRERRNRNSLILNNDHNPLSVQTNPWGDGSQSFGNDNRQDASLLSGPRSARLPPKPNSPLAMVIGHEQISDSPVQMSSTPPASPRPFIQRQHSLKTRSMGLPSKTLQTPPLGQKPPLSAPSNIQPYRDQLVIPAEDYQDIFQRDAVQRHADFLEKERLAISDVDRLQLFAEFVLREAFIRQKRYESALSSGDFDIDRFRSSLFKLPRDGHSTSNSISQVSAEEQEPTTANTTPQTRPEATWWNDYHPALSPIASMGPDEMSSRGRAPSRWWESQTGSQSGGAGGRPMHRSKRESKYMGLSKEFLMAHSPSDEYPNTFSPGDLAPNSSTYPVEKANPDTFGYFDEPTSRPVSAIYSKKPETPALLDISRFITLPPPYPRHYPAVNNNHPDLAQYRTTVRTLGELDEVKSRKAKHHAKVEVMRADHKRRMSDGRHNFKTNVQAQFADGRITYSEAAEAEAAFKMSNFEAEKQLLQSEFDALQIAVINPLHDMLHQRLAQLDSSIQQLSHDLHTDARYQDPDQTQEEGDEKPELLEKLTQLKWLFDVREQIHRECFNLLTDRNDKFKDIVLFPHRYSRNQEKIDETEAFFEKDAQTRSIVYANESLKRHESFLRTIEQHVTRGVELQSSTFWDIAPGLLDLLQKIPEDLRHFQGIKIPDKEYKENPSYHRHPEQYLYSLLSHSEKSTYQFIEGQVNLHCLLHEVKTALLGARYRAMEATEGTELSESKTQQEAALTTELKQKASMIEEQWLEALGSQLQATRGRVKTLLQEDDAWEEIAEDDG